MSAPVVLVVQHAEDCPPALLGDWLAEAGCTLRLCRPYAGDALPDPTRPRDHDALVVLVGPMGAYDDETCDWLGPVKELVRADVAAGSPTLGICLGHQLVAVALGGTVERNARGQQLGLLDVGWTPEAEHDELFATLATPRRGVQWNDDLVSVLPPGATLLAATNDDEVQAVQFAAKAWGVQLHPEVDAAILRPWADDDRGSHEARGIDSTALLEEIEEARAELDEAWRPLAAGFAAVVRRHSDASGAFSL